MYNIVYNIGSRAETFSFKHEDDYLSLKTLVDRGLSFYNFLTILKKCYRRDIDYTISVVKQTTLLVKLNKFRLTRLLRDYLLESVEYSLLELNWLSLEETACGIDVFIKDNYEISPRDVETLHFLTYIYNLNQGKTKLVDMIKQDFNLNKDEKEIAKSIITKEVDSIKDKLGKNFITLDAKIDSNNVANYISKGLNLIRHSISKITSELDNINLTTSI